MKGYESLCRVDVSEHISKAIERSFPELGNL